LNEIEYMIDETPVEAKWLRLELPFPNSVGLYKWRASNIRLRLVKEFMAKEGFRMNIDFMMDSTYYSDKIIVLISPKVEKYASFIILKWDPKYE
jgi:hypothetical protein